MNDAGIDPSKWQAGKTKLFLKEPSTVRNHCTIFRENAIVRITSLSEEPTRLNHNFMAMEGVIYVNRNSSKRPQLL